MHRPDGTQTTTTFPLSFSKSQLFVEVENNCHINDCLSLLLNSKRPKKIACVITLVGKKGDPILNEALYSQHKLYCSGIAGRTKHVGF